ncbi:MAG: hypothetical protein AAF108_03555 [Planctomycetota bacterium]
MSWNVVNGRMGRLGQVGSTRTVRSLRAASLVVAAGVIGSSLLPVSDHAGLLGTAASAQGSAPDPSAEVKRDNLTKLVTTNIDLTFTDQRLEDVLNFLADISGAELEPIYLDDRNAEGLDPELLVSLRARNQSALQVLERVLRLVERGQFTEFSWQMTDWGSVEIGPKPVLNRATRIEIYDIADLLFEIQDYDDFARIDLQQVLQASQQQGGGGGGGGGGGAGGQSPFQQNQQGNNNEDRVLRGDRAAEVIALITSQIETVQWDEFGVEIQYYDPIRTLMVAAPDYIQRQLVGYPWFPPELQQISRSGDGVRFLPPATARRARPAVYETRDGRITRVAAPAR